MKRRNFLLSSLAIPYIGLLETLDQTLKPNDLVAIDMPQRQEVQKRTGVYGWVEYGVAADIVSIQNTKGEI